ncbi:hypothetical protein AHF37_12292 [Paragonimus kellicotti]|nr:hypothetical protein AHF37_12292 [Paragonimus kellicotti]
MRLHFNYPTAIELPRFGTGLPEWLLNPCHLGDKTIAAEMKFLLPKKLQKPDYNFYVQLNDLHDITDRESLLHQHIVDDFDAETSSLSVTLCLQTRSVREHTDLWDLFEVSRPIHLNLGGYNGASVFGTLSRKF